MLDGCGADGVELQREHEAVNAIFTGSTDIIGGISGPGSNVYVCGVPGWVQTARWQRQTAPSHTSRPRTVVFRSARVTNARVQETPLHFERRVRVQL